MKVLGVSRTIPTPSDESILVTLRLVCQLDLLFSQMDVEIMVRFYTFYPSNLNPNREIWLLPLQYETGSTHGAYYLLREI